MARTIQWQAAPPQQGQATTQMAAFAYDSVTGQVLASIQQTPQGTFRVFVGGKAADYISTQFAQAAIAAAIAAGTPTT